MSFDKGVGFAVLDKTSMIEQIEEHLKDAKEGHKGSNRFVEEEVPAGNFCPQERDKDQQNDVLQHVSL